jgi:tetratricopeptide (TPR) repeat protein
MPTRLPFSCRSGCCLAVALAAALGVASPVGAKPPDLPIPVEYDFAPVSKPAMPSETAAATEQTGESLEGIYEVDFAPEVADEVSDLADRCEAMRRLTRCALFALHPLTATVRLKSFCTFDEEAPYPVFSAGPVNVNLRGVLREAAVTLCSGPFGTFPQVPQPAAGQCSPAERERGLGGKTVPLHGGAIIIIESPDGDEEAAEPAQSACPRQESEDQARVAQQYMIAGQVYAQMGFRSEAIRCYQKVCRLCPDTCLAREAEDWIACLSDAQTKPDGAQEEAGDSEEQEVPSVCPFLEKGVQKAQPAPTAPLETSVLDRLDDLEKAARFYEDAETLMHEGRVDKACALYEEIIRLVPGHRFANMAADRLKESAGLRSQPETGTEEPQANLGLIELYQAAHMLLWDQAEALLDDLGFPVYQADPTERRESLLNSSEDLRQIEEEWGRFWFTDQPSHMTYERIHGGIEDESPDPVQKIEKCLGQPITVRYTERKLSEVLKELREKLRINIHPDYRAIKEAGLDLDTRVTATFEDLSVKSCLNLLLHQAGLGFKVQDEVIFVSVPKVLREPLVIRCYPVADVVRKFGGYKGKAKGSEQVAAEVKGAERLLSFIPEVIGPSLWASEGGKGTLHYFAKGRVLVVNQDPATQEQVGDLLDALRKYAGEVEGWPAEPPPTIQDPRPSVFIGPRVNAVEYDVSKLVDAALDPLLASDPNRPADRAQALVLMDLIVHTVGEYAVWATFGGVGKLDYNSKTRTLTVQQTADVQEQVADLLRSLGELRKESKAAFEKMLKRSGQSCINDPCFSDSTGCGRGKEGDEEASSLDTKKSKLDRKLDTEISFYCKNTPLRELLEDIHAWKGVRCIPDHDALEDAGISLDQTVTLRMSEMPLRKVIEAALDQLCLKAEIDGDAVIITTPAGATSKIVSAGYEVSELLLDPQVVWDRPSDRLKVVVKETGARELIRLIKEGIAPETWDSAGGLGNIIYNEELKTLFVQQSPEVQEEIRDFLEVRQQEIDLRKKSCERQVEAGNGPAEDVPVGNRHHEPAGGCCPALPDFFEQFLEEDHHSHDGYRFQGAGQDFRVPGKKPHPDACAAFGDFRLKQSQEPATNEVKRRQLREEARQAYRQALELDPNCTEAQRGLARLETLEKEDGAEEEVSQLLDRCRKALLAGRTAEAEMYAAWALARDPFRVAANPMVYKMQLLQQVAAPPVALEHRLPAIDPSVVRAYNEILQMVPPRQAIEVHEMNGEEAQETPPGRLPRLEMKDRSGQVEIIIEDPKGGSITFRPDGTRVLRHRGNVIIIPER